MESINLQHLVSLSVLEKTHPFRVDLAYARADNFLFGEAIYRPDASLWLHQNLADIVVRAAHLCFERYGLRLVLYDGLRTVEAQEKMLQTQRVQENLHWLEEPRLLSSPGGGAHPRGMAIDLSLEDLAGRALDMGTVFDFLAEDSDVAHNPAHRQYQGHSPAVVENRRKLDEIMCEAAAACAQPLFLLPQEWWDFRLPIDVYGEYVPLSDADLPLKMRMT